MKRSDPSKSHLSFKSSIFYRRASSSITSRKCPPVEKTSARHIKYPALPLYGPEIMTIQAPPPSSSVMRTVLFLIVCFGFITSSFTTQRPRALYGGVLEAPCGFNAKIYLSQYNEIIQELGMEAIERVQKVQEDIGTLRLGLVDQETRNKIFEEFNSKFDYDLNSGVMLPKPDWKKIDYDTCYAMIHAHLRYIRKQLEEHNPSGWSRLWKHFQTLFQLFWPANKA